MRRRAPASSPVVSPDAPVGSAVAAAPGVAVPWRRGGSSRTRKPRGSADAVSSTGLRRAGQTVYFSAEELAFLDAIPGEMYASDRARRVVQDMMGLFELPAHIHEVLSADLAALGCANTRDYLVEVLLDRSRRLIAERRGAKR